MKKSEILMYAGVALAVLGVVGFWFFGIKDMLSYSGYSLIVALVGALCFLSPLFCEWRENSIFRY